MTAAASPEAPRDPVGTDQLIRDVLAAFGDHPHVRRLPSRELTSLRISHRWEGRVIALLFHRRSTPALVVKLDRSPTHARRLDHEFAALEDLASSGRYDGLVPCPVGLTDLPQGRTLVQTGLAGSPLTSVLRRRSLRSNRRRAAHDHDLLRRWFERFRVWHGPDGPATASIPLDDLEERVRLAIGDEAASAARGWLTRLGAVAQGTGAVHVPTHRGHGDLGPSNLLLHRGELRLVDWEGDTSARLRLPDIAVALNHYVRATPLDDGRLPTREEAAERAFLADDQLGQLTRRTWDRAVRALGAPVEVADLLLVDSLVRLSTGDSATAHRNRAQRMWTGLLRRLVTRAARQEGQWPRGR